MRGFLLFLLLFFAFSQARAYAGMEISFLGIKGKCSDISFYRQAAGYISSVSSLKPPASPPFTDISSDEIFGKGLLILACAKAPPDLDYFSIVRLRKYLSSGGILFINNLSPMNDSMDSWARRLAGLLFPSAELLPPAKDSALFRSFFIVREKGGRFLVRPVIEAVKYGDRYPFIYSGNDLFGIFVKNSEGKYLYPCVPGGERQREMGRRILLNIFMYSVTGNYKLDAVHQPYIIRKMRSYDRKN